MCPIDVRVEASVRHGANSDVADRSAWSGARRGASGAPHAFLRVGGMNRK